MGLMKWYSILILLLLRLLFGARFLYLLRIVDSQSLQVLPL